jgi:hypothetical protein
MGQNRISLSPIDPNKLNKLNSSTTMMMSDDYGTFGVVNRQPSTRTNNIAGASFVSTFSDDNQHTNAMNMQTPPFKSAPDLGKLFTPKSSYKTPKTLRKNRHVVINTPKSGHIFGTPDYLCPELLLGKLPM